MSVEVKQLIINGALQQEDFEAEQEMVSHSDLARLREQLLRQCRREMEDILRQLNER